MSSRPPASALAYWITQSGLSKAALAKAITERARARGHTHIAPDDSRVRGWLRGQRPRDPVPALLAEVLSSHCGQPLTPADLGYGQADASSYRGPGDILTDLGEVTAAQLVAGPDLPPEPAAEPHQPEIALARLERWAYGHPHPLPTGHGRRLGLSDARRIARQTDVFREMDNAHGGGASLMAATGHLASVATTVRTGRYTEPTGRALYRQVADLAGVVGWMSHDAAQWQASVRYLTLAVHAARESNDRELTAHLLQCLARVWGYLGRADTAADCIGLALYGARSAHPVLRAGLHALGGRFAALQGQETEALRHITQALELFAQEHDQDLPPFAAYLNEAELQSTCGEVLLFLSRTSGHSHHARDAVTMLTSAEHNRPEERARSRAFDSIGAARSLLVIDDLDGAREAGLRALDVGADLSSVRVRRRFKDLHREAGRTPSEITHDLQERITQALAT
ncbi:hypothetical protein [Nocardiopsis alba]|uniref:hypothetical protein n=1 Tax=Nocardiopsis alba TaxID=53437 RepID=UPI0035E33C65